MFVGEEMLLSMNSLSFFSGYSLLAREEYQAHDSEIII